MIQKFNKQNYHEVSPWLNNFIKIFENSNEIDLHIVAPNYFNSRDVCFHENNITYHFYSFRWVLPKRVYRKLKVHEFTNFIIIKKRVKRIIKEINPDLVHLHGAENPYYSAAILPLIKHFKILVTIQGFISHDEKAGNDIYTKKRKVIEMLILKSCRNFGVRTQDMCNFILSVNKQAKMFWHDIPITKPIYDFNILTSEKIYDCVFFGRVSPENGVEDLLRAISLVKKYKPNIYLVVVGPFTNNIFKDKLKQDCKILGIEDNVEFKGYMATQQLAFSEIMKAKIDVLPTYFDIIPGTILECMYLGIPVIAYAVGGIPELNKDRESLVLVQKGDINSLAEKIILLLNNDKLRTKYSENAKITVSPFFDNQKIYEDLISIYNELFKEKLITKDLKVLKKSNQNII